MDKIWANLLENVLEQILNSLILIQLSEAHSTFKIIHHPKHRNTLYFITKKEIIRAAKVALPAENPHFVTTLTHRQGHFICINLHSSQGSRGEPIRHIK
jgi:hypothetical protein